MADGSPVSQTTGYESELTADREGIAAALSGVTDGLLAGTIQLGTGDDAVSVSVPDDLSLEIEFGTEDDESSRELELEWPDPDADSTAPSIDDRPGGAVEEPTLVSAADGSASLARFEVFRDRARNGGGDSATARGTSSLPAGGTHA